MGEVIAMNYYNELAHRIRKHIDELMQLCEEVYQKEQCEKCPIKARCLRDTSVEEIWSDVSVMRLADFIEYADLSQTEEDRIALAGDDARQAEIDLEITDY